MDIWNKEKEENMFEITKQKLFQVTEIAHLRIFGHEMSDEMRKFLGNLSWSFFGGIVAAGIIFFVNILAGRWLGPEEYGKYSLVFLMSQMFLTPMIFGMDMTISRSISREFSQGSESVRKNISSAFWFVAVTSVLSITILVVLKGFLADVFSTTTDVVIFGILLSFSLTWKSFLDSIAKGFHIFRLQAKIRIFETASVVLVFFSAYSIFANYIAVASAFISAGVFVAIFYLFWFWKFIFSTPDLFSLRALLQYSKFVIASSIVTLVIGYGDRFVVNRYFGPEELGLYSAYYAATIFVFGQITVIMSNVFFPVIASVEKKILIMKKIDKLVLLGAVPATIGIFFVGIIVLVLFGPKYRIDILTLALFSVVAMLQFFVAFYGNIVAVHNAETYFLGFVFYFIRACVYTGYIVILVVTHTLTIPAILLGLIMNYVVDGFNLRYILKKYC